MPPSSTTTISGSNPFSTVQLVSSSSTQASLNPFSNVKLLTTDSKGATAANPLLFPAVSSTASVPSATASASNPESKISKLNNAFLAWIDRQKDTHPLSLWSEGLKVVIIIWDVIWDCNIMTIIYYY
jgi:hypothetical protein